MPAEPPFETEPLLEPPPKAAGRVLLVFLAYVLLAVVGGALSAPWIHGLLTSIVERPIPFNELTIRWMQVLALVGLWPLLAAAGLSYKSGFGLSTGAERNGWRELGRGTVWGVVALLIVVFGLVLFEVRAVRPERMTVAYIPLALLKAAMTAYVVATVEELWFRGALHSVFRRGFGPAAAIALGAALYAAVHFLRSPQAIDPEVAGWLAGFQVLGLAFDGFAGSASWSDFAALTLAGIWLGLARERGANVWVCIGLHAGWVLVIQLTRRLTLLERDAEFGFLVGRFDGVIGWLGFTALLLMVFVFLAWSRSASRRPK